MNKHLEKYTDILGMFASIACAIHCAALPILAALSIGNGWFGHDHTFDNIILILAAYFIYKSFWTTYKKDNNATFLWVAILGFCTIIIGRFIPFPIEVLCSIVGGLTIATAHILHIRYQQAKIKE